MGSNPTLCTSQEHKNLHEFLLKTTNLTLGTIDRRVKAINQLGSNVDLFDTEKVVSFLNQSKWRNGTKNIVVQAYHDYQKMYGLLPVAIKKYHVIQQLPFIPLEQEIDALIAGCTLKLSSFLFLLKETGMRPIEAWSLKWTDIDTVQKTVNIRTAKHGVPRILPVSEKIINLIFGLRNNSMYIFAVGEDVTRFPKELSHFTRNYLDRRREISNKLNNPRLKQISLYTFRHWKATIEYIKTRDIFHCKWLLGHSRLENTMKYIHCANAIINDVGSFTCKIAHNLEEATSLIEQSFEYVTDMNGYKLFRKRK